LSRGLLLDTNALSEPLRPQPNLRLLSLVKRHKSDLFTAAPVWHELVFGASRLPHGAKRDAIEKYLHEVVAKTIPVLPYDAAAAAIHAAERARLVALGRTPSFVDGQIAAIALANGLAVVTANRADFTCFSKLDVKGW
jgi:tRNA(fMet)-specific endonuclease VapC